MRLALARATTPECQRHRPLDTRIYLSFVLRASLSLSLSCVCAPCCRRALSVRVPRSSGDPSARPRDSRVVVPKRGMFRDNPIRIGPSVFQSLILWPSERAVVSRCALIRGF